MRISDWSSDVCSSDLGKGISREGGVVDIGVDQEIVKKSGAWYTYDGEQLGQGRENAKQFLIDNPEVMIEISERIRMKMGLGDQHEEADIDHEIDPDDLPISPSRYGSAPDGARL